MSSRCPSIADRPDRAEIDAALDAGTSLRTIALSHGISKTTLIRYRDSRQPQLDAPNIRVSSRARQAEPDAYASHLQPGANLDATGAAPCTTEEYDQLPPTEAKLREVAKLLAQGLSREEVAARYRVSPSTVTDWHRKIKDSSVALVKAVTAENIVATLLANMHQRSAMLWRIANRAEIAAPRVAIAAIDGLRKEDQHVASMADTLGVLGRFAAHPSEPEDPFSLPSLARELFRELDATMRGETVSEGSPLLNVVQIAETVADHHDERSAP